MTGFFCDFDVYVGKPSDGTVTEVGLGERVVLQLSTNLRGGCFVTTTSPHAISWIHSSHNDFIAAGQLEPTGETSLRRSNM